MNLFQEMAPSHRQMCVSGERGGGACGGRSLPLQTLDCASPSAEAVSQVLSFKVVNLQQVLPFQALHVALAQKSSEEIHFPYQREVLPLYLRLKVLVTQSCLTLRPRGR